MLLLLSVLIRLKFSYFALIGIKKAPIIESACLTFWSERRESNPRHNLGKVGFYH